MSSDFIVVNSRPVVSLVRQNRRQYPADVAGYYSIALRANLKSSAFYQLYSFLIYLSRSDGNFSPARSAGLNACGRLRLSAANLSKILSQIKHCFPFRVHQ
jgi:hypothetical protein